MEKVPKSSIPDIDKKKFLVPADLSGECGGGWVGRGGEAVSEMEMDNVNLVPCHVDMKPFLPQCIDAWHELVISGVHHHSCKEADLVQEFPR